MKITNGYCPTLVVPLHDKTANYTLKDLKQSNVLHAVYADMYTCSRVPPPAEVSTMDYVLYFFNADRHGEMVNHFSCEETGI